jgi:spermidine/putrescine transport system ATP-binding protein
MDNYSEQLLKAGLMTNDKIIELKKISKCYDGKPVVNNLSLTIKKGEFVTLLGPSGCGKTTTLRMIAGFELPTEGQILFGGTDITNLPPHKRQVNTVFQRYALFPHLNVFNNIAFGLKLKRISYTGKDKQGAEKIMSRKYTKAEIRSKVDKALSLVDLADYGHRNVGSLSGGQMQRVAIARALVNEPEVLLLDEPLGALDLKMRKDMQLELADMHKRLGITFIYVTHDQEEALTMSDTIIVMRHGEVQQIGTPQKVYDEPANAFVADFIGESNIFSGTMLKDYYVEFAGAKLECVDKGFKKNEPIDVIIRPEDIYVLKGDNEKSMFFAEVISCVFKGTHYHITVLTYGEERMEIMLYDNVICEVGERIGLYISPSDIHIMHKSRIINELDTEMWDTGVVEICGGRFPCNSELPSGTSVKAEIDFDDVILHDDESDGIIGGTVINSIYKGSYFQCVVRTDDYYDFFIDTEDDWLKGARVGISVEPDKIKITEREVKADE